jgi:hypothetical protein
MVNFVTRWRTILLAASMFIAPLFILAGHLLTVPADEEPTQWVHDISAATGTYVLAQTLIAVGAVLLIVNCVGFMRLAVSRGGTLVTIGSVLVGTAALGLGVGNGMFGIIMGTLLPAHPSIAAQVATLGGSAPAANLPWLLAPALPAGLVLIAVGLTQARTAPLWLPIILGVGGLLFLISGSGGIVTMLLLLPLAVGIAGLGLVVLRGSRALALHPAAGAVAAGTVQTNAASSARQHG